MINFNPLWIDHAASVPLILSLQHTHVSNKGQNNSVQKWQAEEGPHKQQFPEKKHRVSAPLINQRAKGRTDKCQRPKMAKVSLQSSQSCSCGSRCQAAGPARSCTLLTAGLIQHSPTLTQLHGSCLRAG